MQLRPADYVIKVFGGVRATARAVGRFPSSVSKWRQPREKGGCGGQIPTLAQRTILEIAKKKKLDITPDDLMCGRRVKK